MFAHGKPMVLHTRVPLPFTFHSLPPDSMEPCSIVKAVRTMVGLCSMLYNCSSAVAAAEEVQHMTSQLDAFNQLLPLFEQYGEDTVDLELLYL